MTDERLLELLLRAGAKEQGVGQGGAYRELVLTAWLEQDRQDIHLAAFKRFAALVAADEREDCAAWYAEKGWLLDEDDVADAMRKRGAL